MSVARRLAVLPVAGSLLLGSAAVALPASASTSANEIVYVVDTASASQVVVRNLAAHTQQVVAPSTTNDPAFATFDSPELSPDGTKVVVEKSTLSDTGDDTQGLLVVDRAATNVPTVLTSNASQSTDTLFKYDVYPTVSPNGATVLWTHVEITVDPSTGDATGATTELRTELIAGGVTPITVNGSVGTAAGAWSPDGLSIVLTTPSAPIDSSEGPLSLLDPLTGTLTALGPDGDQPVFSPDGTTIALAQSDNSGASPHTFIATMPSAPGIATTLSRTSPTGTNASTPGWSPDGESLTYDLQKTDGTISVWAIDRGGVRAGQVGGSDSADYSTPAFNGPPPADVSTDGVASTFTPVTPTRLLDTRTTTGGHHSKVGQGGSVTLTVAGSNAGGTVIPADATAVVLNVTAVNGTQPTVVRVFPAPASPVPATSSINTTKAGQVIANQVTVKLPPVSDIANTGKVVLYNGAGTVNLLADVAGFYTATGPDKFQPLDPKRILDSRNNTGTTGGAFTTKTRDVQVTGDVPVSGGGTVAIPSSATAVVLNVTATAVSTTTFERVYPKPASAGPLPTVSSLNVGKGQTAANLVTVAVGAGGKVRFQNAAGTAHLVADVAGYYDPSAPGLYVPVTPIRFLDTRGGTGAAPIPTSAGGYVDLKVAGTRGIPDTALAAVLNLTGTANTLATILRAYPSTSTTTPNVSNLNLVKADSRANAAVVKPGSTGRVRILNSAGSVEMIADIAGYFAPAP